MSYFWATALPVFLPVVVLLAGHWAVRPLHGPWFYVLSTLSALGIGFLLKLVVPATLVSALVILILNAVVLIGFLLWQFNRSGGWVWQIFLIALAALQWASTPAVLALTATHVINTELLLNLASIVSIFALCMVLTALLCFALRLSPGLRWPLLLLTGLTLLVPLSGNLLLSLIKLQVVELTGLRLSYAAKTTNLTDKVSYILLLLIILVVVVAGFTALSHRRALWKATKDLIASRIALADYRGVRRVLGSILAIAVLMISGQAYWDVIASRPPQLSEATRIEIAADDMVRMPLTPLMDGNLHRFAWVADDGKVVRFFVINRLEDKIAPAVVFDACILCGDKGYVQTGDQVVCIGCGVHMFKPSLGKPGGCNPIPIDGWKVEGDQLTIPRASLETGIQIFNTVITLDVTDPVTGKKLTNIDAPHRYTHNNHTYFFADEKALEAFRDNPEKYVGKAAP